MKNLLKLTLVLLLLLQPLFAQSITDIDLSDPSYKAINRSVKNGYLTLFSNNSFEPQRAIARRELAFVIDRLLTDIDQSGLNLTKAELQELSYLSKTFKPYLSDFEQKQKEATKGYADLLDSHTTLTYEVSQLTDKINELEQTKSDQLTTIDSLNGDITKLKNQQIYLWYSVIGALIFGLAN